MNESTITAEVTIFQYTREVMIRQNSGWQPVHRVMYEGKMTSGLTEFRFIIVFRTENGTAEITWPLTKLNDPIFTAGRITFCLIRTGYGELFLSETARHFILRPLALQCISLARGCEPESNSPFQDDWVIPVRTLSRVRLQFPAGEEIYELFRSPKD